LRGMELERVRQLRRNTLGSVQIPVRQREESLPDRGSESSVYDGNITGRLDAEIVSSFSGEYGDAPYGPPLMDDAYSTRGSSSVISH